MEKNIRTIIVMRHGERDDTVNPSKYSQNRNNNCPVSVGGLKVLKKDWIDFFTRTKKHIDTIYVSPFLRTLQTANIISEQHQRIFDTKPEVIIDYCISEGQHLGKPEFEQELIDNLEKLGIVYEESLESIKKRSKMFLDNILSDMKGTALIVTHGVVCGSIAERFINRVEFNDNKNDKIRFDVGDKMVFQEDVKGEWELIESDVNL